MSVDDILSSSETRATFLQAARLYEQHTTVVRIERVIFCCMPVNREKEGRCSEVLSRFHYKQTHAHAHINIRTIHEDIFIRPYKRSFVAITKNKHGTWNAVLNEVLFIQSAIYYCQIGKLPGHRNFAGYNFANRMCYDF